MRTMILTMALCACTASGPTELHGQPCELVRQQAAELELTPWDCAEFVPCETCDGCVAWRINGEDVPSDVVCE